MIYVKSTSNVEGIYITTCDDGIEVFKNDVRHTIPEHIFFNLIRRYILDIKKESYSYHGATLDFKFVNSKPLWHLAFKEWIVTFSDVVLDTIVHSNPWQFCNQKEFLKFCNGSNFKYSYWNVKKEPKSLKPRDPIERGTDFFHVDP